MLSTNKRGVLAHAAQTGRARAHKILAVICTLAVLLPAVTHGYGFSVHQLVNRAATDHLPDSFAGFVQWVDDLENLSTAADERKCCVAGESIKHYMDIDDYPEFFLGTLPHTYDEMVVQYGQSRVDGNGTVPWAIDENYQDLITHFVNQDWTNAVAIAADIGHYVADAHNPMHLTVNFNGQLTGQWGIHSRHESEMTNRHLAELVPAPGSVTFVSDPLEMVFDWIDVLYPGVQQILDADLIAATAAGGSTSSDAYYDRLWLEIGDETTLWIRDASLAIASLWYSAWTEAGSPALPGDATGTGRLPRAPQTRVLRNTPNPFNPFTRLHFELAHAGPATLLIANARGRIVRRIALGFRDSGPHTVDWDGTGQAGVRLASGVYRIIISDARGKSATASAVLLK